MTFKITADEKRWIIKRRKRSIGAGNPKAKLKKMFKKLKWSESEAGFGVIALFKSPEGNSKKDLKTFVSTLKKEFPEFSLEFTDKDNYGGVLQRWRSTTHSLNIEENKGLGCLFVALESL